MLFVSDFADGAVLLPVAVGFLGLMGVLGWWRGAAAWLGVAAGAALTTVMLKAACLLLAADSMPDYEVFSPSGHVAGACVTYGGIAMLLGRGRVPAVVLAAGPVAIAFVVGQARVALAAHNLAEVCAGAVIGCAAAWALPALAGPRPRWLGWPAAAIVSAAASAFHGVHLNSEPALQHAMRSW